MQKIKRIWQNKFVHNYIILLFIFLSIEIIFRLISKLDFFTYDSLRIFIGINIVAFTLGFLSNFMNNTINKILNIILVLILSIYSLAELGFKNYLGVYASVSTSSQAEAVTSYIWDFVCSFRPIFYLILIPFIILILYYIFIDRKIIVSLPRKKVTLKYLSFKFIQLIVLSSLIFIYYGSLKLNFMQDKRQALTSYDLFIKPTNPSLVVKNFGIMGFGILDIKEFLLPGKEIDMKVSYNPDEIKDDISLEETEHILIDNEFWKDLIDKETNKNYNTLNKYFISNNTSFTNDFTGYFEGKNLILIMLESGSNLINNPDLYPNLSKLYNEGWTWKNYYSPRNSCSTGNNELSGMTSLYTIYNNCTANVYKNNTYFESIFNLFNNKGYLTNSFHDHFDAYYYRTTIHKNMGSSKFYKVQDMHIKYGHSYGDWASDAEMMKFYLKTLDDRDTSVPFMSWITTVTSHMPYSSSSIYNDLYYDMMPTEYSKDVRRYMSKLKVVDEAIGVLLEGLEERDILDDTVIILYADHYPYGLNSKDLSKAYGYEINIDNNAEQVPFIIYNSKLTPKVFDDYTSYINITPTVANLFNLDYDSRIYMGTDILSDDYEGMVIFADGSWKNDIAFYDSSSNNVKYYTEKTYNDEEILAINEKISLKLKMSSLAIKNNYFNYLKKKIDNYTTS